MDARVVSWRALRFRNMQIRFWIDEGIPFFDLSDIRAVIGDATSTITDPELQRRRTIYDGKQDVAVVTVPSAILEVLSRPQPDMDFFEWLTMAPALVSKGISQRFDANSAPTTGKDYLEILSADADTHLKALGQAVGEIRRIIWSPAVKMDPAKPYISESETHQRSLRASLHTAMSIVRARHRDF